MPTLASPPLPKPDPIPLGNGLYGYPGANRTNTLTNGQTVLPGAQLTPNNPAYYTDTAAGRALVAGKNTPAVLGVTTTGNGNSNGNQNSAPAPAPANPNGVVAAPALPDKSNDIALQNAGLSAVNTQRSSGLSAVQDALNKILGGYSTEAANNQTNYTTQSDVNQNNLQRAKQAALVAAAQGRQGLFGTLSSLGALSGSGIQLANNAVQQGANVDLAGAGDTFGQNQTALDTNIGQFNQANERRKLEAQAAAADAQKGVTNQAAVEQQKIYTTLADDYAAMGNTAKAQEYTQLAASLFPDIATSSIPQTSLVPTAAAYTPATLSNYIAGQVGTNVAATPSNGAALPGLVASTLAQRRRQPGA